MSMFESAGTGLSRALDASGSMPTDEAWQRQLQRRKRRGGVFAGLGLLSIVVALGVLVVLVVDILLRGVPWLNLGFLTSFDSRFADKAGIRAGLVGSRG
jgi:phosphate transport system permease protein